MKKSVLFWIISFVITIAAGYYQRVTGPTYAVSGSSIFVDKEYSYKFDRSESGSNDNLVKVNLADQSISGNLMWKRFNTNDDWLIIEMVNDGESLTAYLPNQPPAGKLIYQVELMKENLIKVLPDEPIVIRFKGNVPLFILIPHVIFIFAAMFLSNRTAFECFLPNPNLKKLTLWTIGLLIFAGFILGPIVQQYAFGKYWTGFPFGTDLTDNKVLVALIGWLGALIAVYKSKRPKLWVLIAALIMFVIFLIPHSMFGSELNYETMKLR